MQYILSFGITELKGPLLGAIQVSSVTNTEMEDAKLLALRSCAVL